MADILLSYTHTDRDEARPIIDLLEDEGWDVWWDRKIAPGATWRPALMEQLAESRAVAVLWSEASAASEWVRTEAEYGLKKGALIPILLEPDSFPDEYADYHATDLSEWDGTTGNDEINALLRHLASIVPPSRIDTARPGYDTTFLGDEQEIPLPGVTGSAAVLRYLHFSVVMNPGRRLAHYSAYNIDGERFVTIPRELDQWLPDPLLPEPLQMNMRLLKHSPYDRGHLMARASVSWGEERRASIAARQAFFWPNVAPQHEHLNRQSWLKLEQYERSVAEDHGRVTGFSGPVFSSEDEPFRGEVELDDGLVAVDTFAVPRAYWKLIARSTADGGVGCEAFLMQQPDLPGARAWKGQVDDFRVPLAELEESGGLSFCDRLHKGELAL